MSTPRLKLKSSRQIGADYMTISTKGDTDKTQFEMKSFSFIEDKRGR